jgi:hypothetical protein
MSDTDPTRRGERVNPTWSFKFVDPKQIEAGEALAPARIASDKGRKFAALHLILTDLSFAQECLMEADKIGLPDHSNLHSKSLIFSAVVSYARPFMTGTRQFRLQPLAITIPEFDIECHKYLIDLRNKHVAHSVNDFEKCEAIAIVVGTPSGEWRNGGAIGVIETQSIGLNRVMIQAATAHITATIAFVTKLVEELRIELYNAFRIEFEALEKWELAPIFTPLDRTKIKNPRPKS